MIFYSIVTYRQNWFDSNLKNQMKNKVQTRTNLDKTKLRSIGFDPGKFHHHHLGTKHNNLESYKLS